MVHPTDRGERLLKAPARYHILMNWGHDPLT